MNRLHLHILAASLTLVGLSIFFYKALVLHFPLVANTTSDLWNVETAVSFQAKGEAVKVELFIPKNTARVVVMDENFISRGFGLSTSASDYNRQAVWTIRKASGAHTLYYHAVIRKIDTKKRIVPATPPVVEAEAFEGTALAAAKALLEETRQHSADTASLVSELFKQLNRINPEDGAALLLGKRPSTLKKIETAVRVLALQMIPARVVHGIKLADQVRHAETVHWLEVYDGKVWSSFDPLNGGEFDDAGYVPWWRGNLPIVTLQGAKKTQVQHSVTTNQEEAISGALIAGQLESPILLQFSLFALPLQSQTVYRVLLMVPIGAFLVVILRNLIGIKTFGTFMPILVALAFRETELLWGILLFTLVVSLGLGVRFYFEHLKLLLVPRLASVLTVVIILMASLSVITHKLGIDRGISVALFPMVILTMTIERMSIVWEERGALEAMKQGIGSLFVATITYLVITLDTLEHLLFVFPELLLVVLAGCLLLGRYTGYRLFELTRFKAFAEGG